MKGIVKKATAVVLAVTVTCGAVMGISVTASAASLSAGALQYGADFSFLEGLFMSAGAGALGLDMLLKTENDINNWDWGEVLDDPATQGQIDNAESKINEWYDNAIKDWYKNHGGSSEPTPTPGTSPPVTVAPINPDDLDIPEDWATLKKNATDKGLLAMGAATAYCVKEAVKGWWDDIVSNSFDSKATDLSKLDEETQEIISGKLETYPYYFYCKYVYDVSTGVKQTDMSIYYLGDGACYSSQAAPSELYIYRNGYCELYENNDNTFYSRTLWGTYKADMFWFKCTEYSTNLPCFNNQADAITYVNNFNKTHIPKLPKTSLWPSVDTKDDYDNNRTLPTPSYPNLAVPSIKLPTLDELKDLWKQGTDDSDNRPTYVTNFITNHTVRQHLPRSQQRNQTHSQLLQLPLCLIRVVALIQTQIRNQLLVQHLLSFLIPVVAPIRSLPVLLTLTQILVEEEILIRIIPKLLPRRKKLLPTKQISGRSFLSAYLLT